MEILGSPLYLALTAGAVALALAVGLGVSAWWLRPERKGDR
ncbi:MAG TPA: hypothetical protein VFX49_07655 [Chloroflexota bacterium]|nr:hypothetical protein [Chloroflexota bacterium]